MREIYLLLVALTCVIALYIHNAIKKHEERRVSNQPILLLLRSHDVNILVIQADKAIGEQYGCLPPPRLQNQRPLGLDRLEQIFRANTESRLMELFLFHFRQTGYTLEQVFLGTPAFSTVEPANLEAILSTNIKGPSCADLQGSNC